ncbi:MAG: rod-binding protein [Clostridium sp.]|nr:rod-binding protein [Clostridium sp.]
MDISNSVYGNYYMQNAQNTARTSGLEQKLTGGSMTEATDEELMDACKEFEAYLVEQVLKQVKESIPKTEEEENQYMEYFGDMMLQEYASAITDQGSLGIAQKLYESMKNNMKAVSISEAEAGDATSLNAKA